MYDLNKDLEKAQGKVGKLATNRVKGQNPTECV